VRAGQTGCGDGIAKFDVLSKSLFAMADRCRRYQPIRASWTANMQQSAKIQVSLNKRCKNAKCVGGMLRAKSKELAVVDRVEVTLNLIFQVARSDFSEAEFTIRFVGVV